MDFNYDPKDMHFYIGTAADMKITESKDVVKITALNNVGVHLFANKNLKTTKLQANFKSINCVN